MSQSNYRSHADAVKAIVNENPSRFLNPSSQFILGSDRWVQRGGIWISPELERKLSNIWAVGVDPGFYQISYPQPAGQFPSLFSVPRNPLPPPEKVKWPDVKMGEVGQCELRTPKQRVPDMVSTILAYRAWEIDEGTICSLAYDHLWDPFKPLEATCYGEKHFVPDAVHGCGIYGFKTLDLLIGQLREDQWAFKADEFCLGVVELWGRYIELENGWRAQYAYPKELWFFSEEFEPVAANYGVKYRVLPMEKSNG